MLIEIPLLRAFPTCGIYDRCRFVGTIFFSITYMLPIADIHT